MLKSSKKEHPHKNLKEIPVKDSKDKKRKLNRIREKESFNDMLTEDTVDEED